MVVHFMKPALRIGVVSASVVVASAIAIGTLEPPGVGALATALAWLSAQAAGALGVSASSDGAIIEAGGFSAFVAAQCTAIDIILVFCAGVLIFPVPLKARMWALALGIPAIIALNFARIISLMLIGITFPEHFDFLHLAVSQLSMVVAAFTIWLLWLRSAYAGRWNGEALSAH
ncbi:MAG: archaeosortase/exosortase family protein [Chloroflexota bacterium]|nr:archaeosortase/exosortase family protein [Chloroflexota bacterium]